MFDAIRNFFDKIILNNRILDYLICIAIIVGGLIVTKIISSIVIKKLLILSKKTETKIDDFLVEAFKKFVIPILYIVSVYFGLIYLKFPANIDRLINIVAMGSITIYILRLIISTLEFFLKEFWLKNESLEASAQMIKVLFPVIQVVVWVVGILFLLDNFGFNVSSMIAGLGISGVAIALASQGIFKDIFNYFVILFDKPFSVGDYVTSGSYSGTIEHIGLKTTRIRSISGEEIVFSNTAIVENSIRNYKKMERRRISFAIGVTYETDLSKLKIIPEVIENIISNIEKVIFDRVHFFSFGDFALNFEIVYYVDSPAYATYMDIQEKINYELSEEFAKLEIEFAYPTQTIFVNKQEVSI